MAIWRILPKQDNLYMDTRRMAVNAERTGPVPEGGRQELFPLTWTSSGVQSIWGVSRHDMEKELAVSGIIMSGFFSLLFHLLTQENLLFLHRCMGEPCLSQGGMTKWPLKAPSNSSHPMILQLWHCMGHSVVKPNGCTSSTWSYFLCRKKKYLKSKYYEHYCMDYTHIAKDLYLFLYFDYPRLYKSPSIWHQNLPKIRESCYQPPR